MRLAAISLAALLIVGCAFAPAWSEDSKVFDVTGRVTMPDGKPAPGAVVEVDYPKIDARSIADESGNYNLRLAPGEYAIIARLGQYVLTFDRSIEIDGSGAITGSTQLKLDPAAVVMGRVIDRSTGKPVAGAKVTMRNYGENETEADKYGAYRFEAVPRTGHTITASKEGYSRPIVRFNAAGQSFVQVDIDVRPEGTVKGKVTDEAGNPIANASIGPRLSEFKFQRAHTDANGEYTLAGLDPTESIAVLVDADEYDLSEQPIVFPAGRCETTLDFRLTHNNGVRTVTGGVMDMAGNPIKDALVQYGWTDCCVEYTTTRSDGNGCFIFKDVLDTKNMVVAEANGFAPSFKFVEPKVNANIDLRMGPGHFVEGKFVDEDGKPLEGVRVGLDVLTPEMDKIGDGNPQAYRWVNSRATSDKNGHFRLDNMPAKGVQIEAYLVDHGRIDMMPLEVDRMDHVMTMRGPGQVSGTVLSAVDGKPIAQFEVGHESDDKGSVYRSADGRFTLRDFNTVRGQQLDLFVRAPGYLVTHLTGIEARSVSKIDFNALRVRLQPSCKFTGVVTDPGGKALEGVLVTLLDTGGNVSGEIQWNGIQELWHATSARTDSSGRFSFSSVPARRGTIALERPGYARTIVPSANLSEPFRARMLRGATVRGVATDDSGRPEKGASVSVIDADCFVDYDSAKTDADGKFCVADLPPGPFMIQQLVGNEGKKIHEVTLAIGQDYTVDWNRVEPCQVEGKVTMDGASVDGAHVIVNYLTGGKMFVGFSDTGKDGHYRFSVHKPGKYLITYSKGEWGDPNHIEFNDTIAIRPGKNRFDASFPSGAISGRLTDAKTGRPMAGVNVCAYSLRTEDAVRQEIGADGKDWSWQHTQPWWWPRNSSTTDADGKFEMSGLAEGNWAIAEMSENTSGRATPVARVRINKNEKRTGLIAKTPALGSAEIKVVDGKTGKLVARAAPFCVNDWGFSFSPWAQMRYASRTDGAVSFSNLPVGRYMVFVVTETFMPARASFEVKPGALTKTTIRLQHGQKIIFRLMEGDDSLAGSPSIGYSVSKPGNPNPVLVDYQGPYWGNVAYFGGQFPRTASLPMEPGIYNLDLTLRTDYSRGPGAKGNLWSGKLKVKVVKGKHTIIDIPIHGK